MQTCSDARLLRDYAERGAEPAFTELVQRHTNLVYSAALRQVESPDIAAEIVQSVFLSLARGAKALSPKLAANASLAGWLCRSARNLSLNHRRDEFRRHTRERHAMEQIHAGTETGPDWETLRRVLDNAMSELNETDYEAIVLRFFQNKDFRTVGSAIGVSDDTAQKRVGRALDKLRELLAQRGVRASAGALAVVISANAVHAAPAGLAFTVSTAAFAGTATGVTTTLTTWISMKVLTATLIGAVIATTLTYLVVHKKVVRLETENQTLLSRQTEVAQPPATPAAAVENRVIAPTAPSDSEETLRLRGQVGALQKQNADLTGQVQSQARAAQARELSERTKKEMQQLNIAAMLYTKQFSNDRVLTNLDQLKDAPESFLPTNIDLSRFEVVSNPAPPENNWPDVIVLRERTARQTADGKWARFYGMVDGQAVEQISADGDFDAWEKQHLMPLQSAR
jgi:RNA polymerase sigma factor (sigma-70 family)